MEWVIFLHKNIPQFPNSEIILGVSNSHLYITK